MNNTPNRYDCINAINLMAKLEEVQGMLDDANDIITKQIEAVEAVIQTLIDGGQAI